jgi:hypothetical protein
VILDLDAVAAVQVARNAGDVQRLAQLLRLMEMISGAALLIHQAGRRGAPCRPSAISVCMSASFFYQLEWRRAAELLAFERIAARGASSPGRTHGAQAMP